MPFTWRITSRSVGMRMPSMPSCEGKKRAYALAGSMRPPAVPLPPGEGQALPRGPPGDEPAVRTPRDVGVEPDVVGDQHLPVPGHHHVHVDPVRADGERGVVARD